jgi:hypothetical protein
MKQTLLVLSILHLGGPITTDQAYVHMPHILQQVALGLGRLLTTYVTTLYTRYI